MSRKLVRGSLMRKFKSRWWLAIVGSISLTGALLSGLFAAQDERGVAGRAQPCHGPYARIAIMRALDGHAVEWEEGTSATLNGTGRPRTHSSGIAIQSGHQLSGSGGLSTRRLDTRPNN